VRNGVAVNHAQPENFEIYRRERRLERLILDGRLTVSLITPDVRVGDLIESSYTIVGLNPALNDQHTAWIAFEWTAPVLDTRHRLRHPSARVVTAKAYCKPPEETRTEHNGVVDRRWRAYAKRAGEPASLAPPWLPQMAELQFSESGTWSDVSTLFSPLYDQPATLPDDLVEHIDALARVHDDRAVLAAEALRFVQSSVRYLAISLGEGGYQPRSIEAIWQTRYGDCKDVSRLLCAIARRLGFEAAPALVNTQVGEGLADSLPSPTAFDHCIVRLTVNAKPYWMDATMRPQGGALDTLHQPFFGYALPLTGPGATLEKMAAPTAVTVVQVEEDVTLPGSISDPATYQWTTTYADWKADSLRDELRNEGEAAVAKKYLRQVRDVWPLADVQSATTFQDDPIANRLTVRECYRLPMAWRQRDDNMVEFSTKDFFMHGELVRVEFPPRAAPIHLARPRTLMRTVRVKIARYLTQPRCR
jgi:hypothetical protein